MSSNQNQQLTDEMRMALEPEIEKLKANFLAKFYKDQERATMQPTSNRALKRKKARK